MKLVVNYSQVVCLSADNVIFPSIEPCVVHAMKKQFEIPQDAAARGRRAANPPAASFPHCSIPN